MPILLSNSKNRYIYSEKNKYAIFVPNPLLESQSFSENLYYQKKYEFLKEKGFFSERKIEFETNYKEYNVLLNLANLRQILIEVTDHCNLKCKYCGYGELYSNHDRRETKNQTFENTKIVIDYLIDLWNSKYNISVNNIFSVGFYGGEPLLNVKLIKQIIEYLENKTDVKLSFDYNMTTNAILLDQYMDFIAEKKIRLLISLDGDKYGSSYRVDKNGKESFNEVVSNVHKLREKYPDYFNENVNFNVVLHDRNSVYTSTKYIRDEFGKIPRITELNSSGISKDKVEVFNRMFKSKLSSFKEFSDNNIDEDIFDKEGDNKMYYHRMLMSYTGNYYKNYFDLFSKTERSRYIPSGTCKPFEKKMFLTVNGKLLPCERIGQEFYLGTIADGKLNIDTKQISDFYSNVYRKLVSNCARCKWSTSCSQCFYFLNPNDEKISCPNIFTEKKLNNYLDWLLSYSEENPQLYFELMSNIAID